MNNELNKQDTTKNYNAKNAMAVIAPRPVRALARTETAAPVCEEVAAELVPVLVLEPEVDDTVVELLGVLTVPLLRTFNIKPVTILPLLSYTVWLILVEVTETNAPTETFVVTPFLIMSSIPATRSGTSKFLVMLEVISLGLQTGAVMEVWVELDAVIELKSSLLYWALRFSKSMSRLTVPLLLMLTKP